MNVTIDHPTDRPNFTNVTIGDAELWFSYRTLIAFQTPQTEGRIVRKNQWGPTTGKHLNYLSESSKTRYGTDDFDRLCNIYLGFSAVPAS